MTEPAIDFRKTPVYARAAEDFYRDPDWCTERLLESVAFVGPVFDPCCGTGTIPRVLEKHGLPAGGADLVYRGYGEGGRDFLADAGPHYNLIFNPPFARAEEFILHALDVACFRIAVLVRIAFLASQRRRSRLFDPHPPERVLVLSTRPSMPPGSMAIEAKGGKTDYCWIVWNNDRPACRRAQPTIAWLP